MKKLFLNNNINKKHKQKEIVNRKETDTKIVRYLEEKINYLKTDIAVETKTR
jgi:hypothetical protein